MGIDLFNLEAEEELEASIDDAGTVSEDEAQELTVEVSVRVETEVEEEIAEEVEAVELEAENKELEMRFMMVQNNYNMLDNAITVLSTTGISSSVMMLLNADGSFGKFIRHDIPACESFDAVPSKDIVCQEALEAAKEKAAKWGKVMADMFDKILNWLKQMFNNVFGRSERMKSNLAKIKAVLKSAKIDDSVLKAKKLTAFSYDAFDNFSTSSFPTVINEATMLLNTSVLDGIADVESKKVTEFSDKLVKALNSFGIEVNGTTLKRGAAIKPETKTFGDLGWDTTKLFAKRAVCETLLNAIDSAKASAAKAESSIKNAKAAAKNAGGDDDKAKSIKAGILVFKHNLSLYNSIVSNLMNVVLFICNSYLNIARAAIAASKTKSDKSEG